MTGTAGPHLYDELIAAHTIMRRSTDLTVLALRALTDGRPVRGATLARLITWQGAFVHHHHESEDELFWPVLRERSPEVVAGLDALSVEHDKLDTALRDLSTASAPLPRATAAEATTLARSLLPTAAEVRDILHSHLDGEEPVLEPLLLSLPDDVIERLRRAVVAGAPKSGPEWVLGLMENPARAQGYDVMMGNFPPPVRWLRPVLLRRYAAARRSLAVD